MQFADTAPQTVDVAAGGSVEVRFDAAGRAIGRARVRMTVKLGERDRRVRGRRSRSKCWSRPRRCRPSAKRPTPTPRRPRRLALPAGVVHRLRRAARRAVVHGAGRSRRRARAISSSIPTDARSSADRARWRCCWPPISATRSSCRGSSRRRCGPTVQSALEGARALPVRQRRASPTGPASAASQSPYLTAYLLHVFQVASDLKYDVDPVDAGARLHLPRAAARGSRRRRTRAGGRRTPPGRPSRSRCSSKAAATRIRTSRGSTAIASACRSSASRTCTTRWSPKARPAAPRADDLRRRMANAILPEAATAHVEELNDPYLLWFWNSNIRSTAIVLSSMVKANADGCTVRVNRALAAAGARQGSMGEHAGERDGP